MNNILPPWPLLSAFLAASFLLAVTPGPGVFYIVTRSVMQGRRHGLASGGERPFPGFTGGFSGGKGPSPLGEGLG